MKYKILAIILFIYLCLVGVIIYFNNINNTKIVIFPNVSIKYEGKKWKSDDFNEKTNYNIYVDSNLYGNGLLTLDEGFIYFNNDISNNWIALSNNKTKVISYKSSNINTDEYKKVLNELNIEKYANLKISKKIDIDYDNDGKIESIYILSNLFVDPFMEDIEDNKFSLAYTIDNEKMNILYKKNFTSDMTGCLLDIKGILDVNKDNKYEIITTCAYFDQIGTDVQIYELVNNEYRLVKEI